MYTKYQQKFQNFDTTGIDPKGIDPKGTSIQMYPALVNDVENEGIDKFIALELMKIAATLAAPAIKQGFLEESINRLFDGIYENVVQQYVGSIHN